MRWLVLIIFTLIALVLEQGLGPVLVVNIELAGADRVRPSFLLVLAGFIGLMARRDLVVWPLLGLGLLTDLLRDLPAADGRGVFAVIGPAALGFAAAGVVMRQIRGLVFRDSAVAVAVLVFFGGAFAHLVTVALLTLRGLPVTPAAPIPGFDAPAELVARFFCLIYSALLALPLGWVLVRLEPLWGFAIDKNLAPTRFRRTG